MSNIEDSWVLTPDGEYMFEMPLAYEHEFELPDGMTKIGAVETNGKLFIFATDEDLSNLKILYKAAEIIQESLSIMDYPRDTLVKYDIRFSGLIDAIKSYEARCTNWGNQ